MREEEKEKEEEKETEEKREKNEEEERNERGRKKLKAIFHWNNSKQIFLSPTSAKKIEKNIPEF